MAILQAMTVSDAENYTRKDRRNLRLILLLAIIHGMLYVFIMPPWQHYDEPNHFEHVWLAATLDRLPQEGDRDDQFNRTVMESMLRNDFFRGVDYVPQLGNQGEPLELFGLSQLSEPPLYYLIASIPIRVLNYLPVEQQLITVRLVSLAFLLLTVFSAWGIACQLTDSGHPLRWMLPLTLALLPGFVELMTAVNNDAAAVGMFSLFLWASVCVFRNDVTIFNMLGVIVTAVLTFFTKSTAVIAFVVAPFVLLFAFMRGKRRKIAWGVVVISLLSVIAISLRWGDAAFWYRGTSQPDPTRTRIDSAMVGEFAFFVDGAGLDSASALFQIIPEQNGQGLAGKEVTLGGWIWANQPVNTLTPVLKTASQSVSKEISIDQTPKFFAFSINLPTGPQRMWVKILPELPSGEEYKIYYDGLFLVEGAMTSTTRVSYKDIRARQIGWDEQIKQNYLRNGSAERSGPRLQPIVDQIGIRILPDQGRASQILTSLYDSASSSYLYLTTVARLFRTFWAEFGWGHISLSPARLYVILFFLTVIGLVGFVINLLRTRRHYPWDVIFIFGLAIGLSWGMTFVRGAIYLDVPGYYIPVARYAYPVIIPTLLIIVQGWIELGNLVRRFWQDRSFPEFPGASYLVNGSFLYAIFFFILIFINITSVLNIISYYQSAGV